MSRSNFSNCKNPDAVVQCALRIDRASREPRRTRSQDILGGGWPAEGGWWEVGCTCRLQFGAEVKEKEREKECVSGAVTARPLTLRRQPNPTQSPSQSAPSQQQIQYTGPLAAPRSDLKSHPAPPTHLEPPQPTHSDSRPQFNVRTTV